MRVCSRYWNLRKNANAPVRNQKLEDHGLECPACGNKGAEKIVPKEDVPDW
jgi:hypothetical protein